MLRNVTQCPTMAVTIQDHLHPPSYFFYKKIFNMNYVLIGFHFNTIVLFIGNNLVNLFKTKLTAGISESFKYGKYGPKKAVTVNVPKSWFKHFYVIALFWYAVTFTVATAVYMMKQEVPIWVIELLNVTCGDKRTSFVSPTQAYVAICLMTLQVVRRFHDTQFVSVFGKNSYMSVSIYMIGIVYYPATSLAILCESPKFAKTSPYETQEVDFSSISYLEMFAIVLFLWAWWHQYTTSKILANLRKNKKGEVTTSEHKLPYGDWFEYVSSPPQAAEILMYTALTVFLHQNTTWISTYIFVVVNQVQTMLLGHWWYQETFKEMPKNRKAVIPFIY